MSLPEVYKFAEWRNTTPVSISDGRLGIGFTFQNGEVMRLALTSRDAAALATTLLNYLENRQPDKS